MNIIFRVDASSDIGSGHIMRDLAFAELLRVRYKNAKIYFVSRFMNDTFIKTIENKFNFVLLTKRKKTEFSGYASWLTVSQDIDALDFIEWKKKIENNLDILIVDHYSIDFNWETKVKPYVDVLLVVDDLANRKHFCDILLDQNYYSNYKVRYKDLVPDKCRLLLGPQYVILRDEFYEIKKTEKPINDVPEIFVFFGGSDLTGETLKTVNALMSIKEYSFTANIVVGEGNRNKSRIKRMCKFDSRLNYYQQVDSISKIMYKSDFAIGADGITTWERMFLGVPSMIISTADSQDECCHDCAEAGFFTFLGKASEVTEDMIRTAVIEALLGKKLAFRALMFSGKPNVSKWLNV